MRIQAKQRLKAVRFSLLYPTILLPYSHDQICERLKGQPVCPKLYVPRLVRRHHQIEARILLSRGIAAEKRRQRDGPPILTYRCPRRGLLAHRVRERLNGHIRSTEPLHEELQGTGHLAKRHTA